MVELAFHFDAPVDAEHVSSEHTQAKLDEFLQMPWIEPNYQEATLIGLDGVERYWHRYSPSALRLQSGSPPAHSFLTEAGTAPTSTSTTGQPSSARNPPCT